MTEAKHYKVGKYSDAERQFIATNKDTATVDDIALTLNRPRNSVLNMMAFLAKNKRNAVPKENKELYYKGQLDLLYPEAPAWIIDYIVKRFDNPLFIAALLYKQDYKCHASGIKLTAPDKDTPSGIVHYKEDDSASASASVFICNIVDKNRGGMTLQDYVAFCKVIARRSL